MQRAATRHHSPTRARARTVHSVVKTSEASGTVDAHALSVGGGGGGGAKYYLSDITNESR